MNGGGDRRGKGKEKERKWREKGEKVKVKKWMVNEVNGERGEFDEYDVCSEWQKGQKWLYIKKRWVADWLLNIVADWFLNIQVEDFFYI